MLKTFEIIVGLIILCFLGVVLWQITNVEKSNQLPQIESSENYEIHESDVIPVIPEETNRESISENSIEINPEINQPTVCTMDAKMCPDGSFVGRVGPNCEFKECPVSEPFIRYGEDVSYMEEYRKDCESRGGIFNECDSACGPETDMCIAVCSMTCSIYENKLEEDVKLEMQ